MVHKKSALILVLDCKNKRYSRQAIWAAGAAQARSIPAGGCDERATKPAAQRANGYIAYFCNQTLGCLLALLGIAASQAQPSQPWPGPIPCRVQDGPNKDLWIMTLGQPQS